MSAGALKWEQNLADYIISCHATYVHDFPLSHTLVGIPKLVIFKNHAGTLRLQKSAQIFAALVKGEKIDGSEIWTEMAEGRCYPSLTLRGTNEFESGIYRIGGGMRSRVRDYPNNSTGALSVELDWLAQNKPETVYLLTCTEVVSKVDPREINKYFDHDVRLVGGAFGVEKVMD
jgi:hypothetical protein